MWRFSLCVLLCATTAHGQVPFLRGDVNDDGRVSIADAHSIGRWLSGELPPPACLKAADANDDGQVTTGLGTRCGQLARISDPWAIFRDRVTNGPCLGRECASCLDTVAEPHNALGEDPTPDGLTCASYTGSTPPATDPQARLEILDAVCPGGKNALAVLKVRLSHSGPIGGYSGVVDGAGILARALAALDVDGSSNSATGEVQYAIRGGNLSFGLLENDDLPARILPPAVSQVALKIYLQLAPGTPAGQYPLIILEAELADSITGRAILPALVDGVLTVAEDVAFDATAETQARFHRSCNACESLLPTGPEDVQVHFSVGLIPAEKGSRVTVPVWLEANVPVEGFTFAIVHLNQHLRLEQVIPRFEVGREWEIFEHKVLRKPEANELTGRAIFGQGDPAASLLPGQLHHVLDLGFQLDPAAPDGLIGVALWDLALDPRVPDRTAPALTTVRAYGQFLHKGQVTCLEHNATRNAGVLTGHNTKELLRGDANADGAVSLADAVLIGHATVRGGTLLPCEDAADVDDDGGRNLADAIQIFRHLFDPAPPETAIPPPFPEPSRDETLDPLPCESYSVTPARLTQDVVRLGAAEAAPGESVEIPIHVSTALPIDAYQLVVRYDPEVFTPTGGGVRREGGVFATADPYINFIRTDFLPGHFAVAFAPDLIRPPAVPAGSEVLVGKLTGFLSDGVSPDDEIPIELVLFAAGDEPWPDRLRTEITVVENGRPVVILPTLEAGVIRIVDGSEATFLRGDANADLEVNISDPVYALAFLFLGGPGPACEDAADADDSGRLELTDAIITLGFLFGGDGTRPLPPPYPERGRDSEPDDLAPCR